MKIGIEEITIEIREKLFRSSNKYNNVHFIYCDECRGTGLKYFGSKKDFLRTTDFSLTDYCDKCLGVGGYLFLLKSDYEYMLCWKCKGKGYLSNNDTTEEIYKSRNLCAYKKDFSNIKSCDECDGYGVVDWLTNIIPPDKTSIDNNDFGGFYK